MARQIPTSAELMQVQNDFETFFLPLDASLDLGTRTTYGTTDPDVSLSMVNIRHLNNTRGFRGLWSPNPTDGNEPVAYIQGQVILDTNGLLYRKINDNAMNPDPTLPGQTEWEIVGREVMISNEDSSATVAPGLRTTESGNTLTIHFARYRGGNGIEVDNTTGVIRAIDFALTDVHVEDTALLRNAETTITWHIGDVAIVTSDTGQATTGTPPTTQGQGTYVYTGNTSGNNHQGITVNDDWTLLALPGNAVTSVAGIAGPTVQTQQIIDAIDGTDRRILTDAESNRIASRYSDAGPPAADFASTTREIGDVYVDTTNDNFYFYSGADENWIQANPATLNDVGNVTITSAMADHLIRWNGSQWVNVTPQQVGNTIPLGDLQDTTITAADNHQLIRWDSTARSGAGGWVNVTPADVGNTIELSNLSDIPNEPTTGEHRALLWNPTDNVWFYQDHTLNNLNDTDVASPNAPDVLARNPANDEWISRDITAVTGQFVDLNQLADVTGNPGPDDVLVRNLGDTQWIPAKINNANLANPTGVEAGGRRILIFNESTNAWAYVSPEEQALGSIFDIGDVQMRQDITPVTYSLPTGNVQDARILTAEVQDAESGENPVDDSASIIFQTGSDISSISNGDRIGFVNAAGTASETNGPEGFVVSDVNTTANTLTISTPDGSNIIPLVRTNIASSQRGEPKFAFLFIREGGVPEAIEDREILQYNATSSMWENVTHSEAGILDGVVVGDIEQDATGTLSGGTASQTATVQNSIAFIDDATIDRAGVMSNTDKDKLDHIPEAPQTQNGMPISPMNPAIPLGTTDHYVLGVERTATTGSRDDQYEETWMPISNIVANGAAAIVDQAGTPQFAPDIDAGEVRNLLEIAPQGVIINYTLTEAAGTFNMGTWSGSTTGVITHPDITSNAIVYLNGTLLQETTDYVINDTANTITLVANIRNAIVTANNWCLTVLDEIDPSTTSDGVGRVVDRRAEIATAEITTADLTTGLASQVNVPINDSTGNQRATYTVIAGVVPLFSVDINTVADWAVSSVRQGTTELGFESVTGMTHEWAARFSGTAEPITITLVGTNTDAGIFYENATDSLDVRLDNVPPDQGDIQLLGFDTTDTLDGRYLQDDSSNPYQTQSDVTTAIANAGIVPVNITRGDAFPTDPAPEPGDQHFLTAAIYPSGTAFTPQTVRHPETGTAATSGVQQATVPDPNRGYNIVAGTYNVTDEMRPAPPRDRTVILSSGTGHLFGRDANRDRAFSGVNVRTSVQHASTVTTTSVVEYRYNNVTVNGNPLRNATLHDFHYRQAVRTGISGFATVTRNWHFINIQFSDGSATINPTLTQANAISMIEGFVQDQSSLEIALVQLEALPLTFPSTAQFRSRGATVFESLGQVLIQTYSFTPMNGFTIDRSRTTINSVVIPDSDYAADGSVSVERNENNVQPWVVNFTRDFPNVPTTMTDPDFNSGQYIYRDGWREVMLVAP